MRSFGYAFFIYGDIMEYNDRLTKRIKHDEQTYFYMEVASSRECTQRLGMYEDFGLTPQELAKTLTEYELQKPRDKWDMDKIERWQCIEKRANLKL